VAATHRQTFFVGGSYAGPPETRVMHGQMYVEMLTPEDVRHAFPLVLMHGAGQTAVNFMTTPDGRQGWAEWFCEQGWKVFVIDQPARGRSAWQPSVDQALTSYPLAAIEALLTAPEDRDAWPQAKLHTQWPGGASKGHAGDPVFDQFMASQTASLSYPECERVMQAAGAALLDRIGPAVLVGHSQGGLFCWLIADARPALTKAIVALEPAGPPYKDTLFKSGVDRLYGLTTLPLAYDPPVAPQSPLEFEQDAKPDADDVVTCWVQKGRPRRLKNLVGIPVLLASSEASHHATYDHCTARYLEQAGVKVDFVRLADKGIRGNGHMMMLEMNNLEIAAFLNEWLTAKIG